MGKTALVLQHVAFEDLGLFAPVLAGAGYAVRQADVGLLGVDAAQAQAADLLIVLGGPIGVYEEEKYPFLTAEIALLEQRLSANRPTMGICLGAQLMARALGARVYAGPVKEIGFAPLMLTDTGRQSCLASFEGLPVLHWHGDTFDLPHGTALLASTPACAQQAFARGPNAIGFQFHPEAGAPGFERWLIGHACELAAAGKSVPRLREEYASNAPRLVLAAEECLRLWLAGLQF